MPAEHPLTVPHDQPQDQLAQQIKFCSYCHSTLADHASIFLPDADVLVCQTCRDHIIRTPRQSQQTAALPPVAAQQDQRASRLDTFNINRPTPSHEGASRRPPPSEISPSSHNSDSASLNPVSPSPAAFQQQDSALSYHHGAPIAGPSSSQQLPLQHHHQQATPQASSSKAPNPPHASAGTSKNAGSHIVSTPPSIPALSTAVARRPQQHQYNPQPQLDPLVDITRLRVRSQGHHCLYPGATFDGTQKSGRNSYEVNVTIVDVDFASSFLCGYLRIRGLTDDWPELTTYFDAEIIGSRYGFLTQNWGATEHEDMVHWARFPAFKHVKSEAKRPHMTIDDRDRGAVFMRWKEKFLVPDHRVQDISGASFAGFYYVCVDFNSQAHHSSSEVNGGDVEDLRLGTSPSAMKTDSTSSSFQSRRRRTSSSRHRRSPSAAPRTAPVATMSGFYYHANSEPYQQLSLTHVEERTSSTFEFR